MRIDNASEPITIYGVALLLAPTLLPIMTGSSGSTHGASTVRRPATNEISSNVMTYMVLSTSARVAGCVILLLAVPSDAISMRECCVVTPYCFLSAMAVS